MTTHHTDAITAAATATGTAESLWNQLVAHQPGTAAALAVRVRALPEDWAQREFGVGRPDAAVAQPPDVEPDETAFPINVAPVRQDGVVDRCRACSVEDLGDCRWHRGYAAGVMALFRSVVEALTAEPRMPDAALLEWLDVAATTVGLGEPVPEPPPATTANRGEATPCSDPPCNHDDDGHLCDTHGTERAHARGDHQWCGITCEAEFSTAKLRNGILWRAAPGSSAMLDELLRRAATGQPTAAAPAAAVELCSCGVLRTGPGRHLPECPNGTATEGPGATVAYRNPDRPGVLLCRAHGDGWAGLTPLTSDDLPDGGICTYPDCGADVLIPQGGAE